MTTKSLLTGLAARPTSLLLPMFMLLGCSSPGGHDESGAMMNEGLGEARSGVEKTQNGLNQFTAGAPQPGLNDVSSGIDLMNQGMAEMRNAMGMMSAHMMSGCTDSGLAMMQPMQSAMDEMNQGKTMLSDGQSSNDAEGMGHMNSGLSSMSQGLDQAQTSMTCMGHSMSSGMM